MHQNKAKLILFLVFALLLGCEKAFDPKIKGSDASKYVINGGVFAGADIQTVHISLTSPISEPQQKPVNGCQVSIVDDRGNNFILQDMGDGDYQASIDQEFLSIGTAFRLDVLTRDGKLLQSDFDTLLACPAVESVYYELEKHEGNNPQDITRGAQFYLDYKGSNTDSRNMHWELVETYEYRSMYAREWVYDGEVHHIVPSDFSLMYCWKTAQISQIFTLTTSNLNENAYSKLPLHFVNNKSVRFEYGYSLLVKQFSLTNAAFNYWDQMRQNSQLGGSLYETQPLAIKGNINNLSDPDQEVLGYFGASQLKTQRIFTTNPGLELEYNSSCSPTALRMGLREIDPSNYPAYLLGDEVSYSLVWLNEECVDCTSRGGINVKPDFWPN